ncbi:MAG: nuclear transport factor 2 family protein [Thermoplasmatota archaeon]
MAPPLGRIVATIGGAQLDKSVFEFFDALRSYDSKRAAAVLADDADWKSPWSTVKITGREAIEKHLASWLGDARSRPSLTIKDIAGDGAVTRLAVSVSGRFGQKAALVDMDLLCLQHRIHHVEMRFAA